jgi:predicted metal-dependent hydrolase
MNSIRFGTQKIYFEIEKVKRRKTVAIQVQTDAKVIVATPSSLADEEIRKIVSKRAGWIIERQKQVKRLESLILKKEFISGESFSYLGRQYRLKVITLKTERDSQCKLINGRFIVVINKNIPKEGMSEQVKAKLLVWYLERAKEKINERINYYARLVGKMPKKTIIASQGKRWGSCSHSGIIRMNWKIIMAPVSILDYVIVHELYHLLYPNHSTEFWRKVGSIIPDYKNKRQWLKENNMLIQLT